MTFRTQRCSRRWLTLLAGILVLAVAGEAAAAGLYLTPHGARGVGRGGAAAVGVWDLNALWYNPALLMGVDETLLMADLNLINKSITFARAPRELDNGGVVEFQPIENEALPVTVPQLGVAHNFGMDKFMFAFGAYGPSGAASRFPEDGPQRYTLVDSEGTILFFQSLAVAYAPSDRIWLGVGLQNLIADLRLVNVTSGYPGFTGDPEDSNLDILVETKIATYFNPSANLGAFAKATDWLQFGLSVQLPFFIQDDEAEVRSRIATHPLFEDARIDGQFVKFGLELPLITRAGVRVEQDAFDVELNVVHERWSALDELVTEPVDVEVKNVPGIGTIPVGRQATARDLKDTWSVRLGGDYHLLPKVLDVRTGVFWEQGAVPSHTLSVLEVDLDKVGFGVGGTWKASDKLDVDFGYSHVFSSSVDVTDSEVRQINPTNEDGATIVGNGKYEAAVDMLSVGVRMGF